MSDEEPTSHTMLVVAAGVGLILLLLAVPLFFFRMRTGRSMAIAAPVSAAAGGAHALPLGATETATIEKPDGTTLLRTRYEDGSVSVSSSKRGAGAGTERRLHLAPDGSVDLQRTGVWVDGERLRGLAADEQAALREIAAKELGE